MRRERGHELGADAAGEHADVGGRRRELHRAGLQPREVEQLRGELAEPIDLLADLTDELASRLVVELLVLDQLEEAAQREDRRAQLVAGGRDEAPASVLEALELALHVRERLREAPELVARGVGEVRLEVADRDALRDPLEAQQAHRQRARDEHAGEQRDEQRDRGREQDPRAHRARPSR